MKMKLRTFQADQMVSPVNMYVLDYFDTVDCQSEANDGSLCLRSFDFQWIQTKSCTYHFICEYLDLATYSANHGLVLLDSNMKHQEIQLQNVQYNGSLSQNQILNVEIWFVPGSTFDLKCYLWFDVPDMDQLSNGTVEMIDDEMMVSLVSLLSNGLTSFTTRTP